MTDNYFCCFCFAWTLLQFSTNETAYGLDNRYSQRSSKFDSGSHELQKRLAVAFPVKVKVNMWHNVKKERTTEQVQMNLSVCYNISPFTHCLKWNDEWNYLSFIVLVMDYLNDLIFKTLSGLSLKTAAYFIAWSD